MAAVFCVVLLLWVELWPFQEKPVVQNLDEANDSKLRLRTFYRTYFPFPGCVLERLEFNHGSNTSKPLITVPLSPSQEVSATRPRCWRCLLR
jgi:hypothetical protein